MRGIMDKEFLYEMLSTASVSGTELELEKKIYHYMKPFADEVRGDEIGDVTAVINPACPVKVLMTGHADEIGLMVTAIREDGMLSVCNIGGIYTATYPGHKVRVLTKNGVLYGAVLITRDLMKKADLSPHDLIIDIGASNREEAQKEVSVGDRILFDTDYRELLHERITGRALDDRLGAFIVMEALKKAKEKGCRVGVYAAATVGEETSMNGAYFVSQRVKPTMAIAVDVTYVSDYAGTNAADTGDVGIGKGPVLCANPTHHPEINRRLVEAANRCAMSVQWETATGRTGTDGDVMHKSGDGVPVALVSIPLRYMHSPAEVASLNDVQDCIDLLAEFVCGLDETISLNPFV